MTTEQLLEMTNAVELLLQKNPSLRKRFSKKVAHET